MKTIPQLTTLPLILATLASQAIAADYFVAPSGADASPGSISAPWKTFQKAASSVRPGDTVFLRAGNYREIVSIGVSGTATAPITFRNYQAEAVTMDMTGVSPRSDLSPVIRISNRSHITLQGLQISNFRTSSDASVPVAILVDGACAGVKLIGNKISRIEQNNTVKNNFDANAHGIALYGTSSTPISDVLIQDNELSFLRLGASEALAINGNVSGFTVRNNRVFNCNNIGIDAIGYEGTCPTASLDRARSGLIVANTVYNIDSSFNPAYGGDLTKGGGYRAAAGIYVDGGTQTLIERNHVYASNFGIELASEHAHGRTDYITVRSNLVRHNHQAGLIMGGYDADRGVTENCVISGNTLYCNDSLNTWSGQIQFQYFVQNNRFDSNIVWGRADNKLMINHYTDDSGTSSQRSLSPTNTFAANLYFCTGGTSSNVTFQAVVNGGFKGYTGLTAWQRSGVSAGDSGSSVVNPAFTTAAPTTAATLLNFALKAGSPAINTGLASATALSTELDLNNGKRINGGRIDRGADEF